MKKSDFLQRKIQHLDIKAHRVADLVEAMQGMAYSARDLARAAEIYDHMLRDPECGVILCLAGSLISAGLKQVFVDLVRHNMVDCIVSTGANIVDQDFFEALGFSHYLGEERLRAGMDDATLRELHIDRIYDTLIDEDELRICDETVGRSLTCSNPGLIRLVNSFVRWALILRGKGRQPKALSWRPTRKMYPSSAHPSAIVQPASAWSCTSTRVGSGPR